MELTEDQKRDSLSVISQFIEDFNLQDNFGSVKFAATIEFTVLRIKKYIDSDITIVRGGYNNYGVIELFSNEIDPYKLPAKFDAKFQSITYVPEIFLKISGIHKSLTIGKYEVVIIPKKKS